MEVITDRRKIIRSRILESEIFHGIDLTEIGTVTYPGWFIECPDAESRNAFRDRILVAYTNLRPHEGEAFFLDSYVYRVNPWQGTSQKTVFEDSASCTMCQFVMLGSFFPEILGTNIIEFAPLMHRKTVSMIKEGQPITSGWILENCFKCPICRSDLPGRYRPEYHPLVIKSAEGGENFPSHDESDYADVADSYEELLLSMIRRKDKFIVMNGAARDILAGSVGTNYCKVWSNNDNDERALEDNPWYATLPRHAISGTGYNQVGLLRFGEKVLKTKRKLDEGDELKDCTWGPNGITRMFFDYVSWYVTDPRPMSNDLRSKPMKYALACIANVDG